MNWLESVILIRRWSSFAVRGSRPLGFNKWYIEFNFYPLIFLIDLIFLAGAQPNEMSYGGSEEVLSHASSDGPEIMRQESNLPLEIQITPMEYILTATLGQTFSPHLITIISKKDHRLLIAADSDDHRQDCKCHFK